MSSVKLHTGIIAVDRKRKIDIFNNQEQKAFEYMQDDRFRRWEFLALSTNEYSYTDGDYWWTDSHIKALKLHKYGFADGFVEHVLKKLEENNG